jgi:hypothetical protein
MAVNTNSNVYYGLDQPFLVGAPTPIISNRDPVAADRAPIGTIWVNQETPSIFVLAAVAANTALWVATAGGGAIEEAITVTTGPNSISGTTTINTTTASTTTIGTGGTGAVNIGNATGNTAVTGRLTASTGLVATTGGVTATAGGVTATAGNITAAAGNIVATLGNITATAGNLSTGADVVLTAAGGTITFAPGPSITSGAGAPAGALPKGSLYLRTDGTGTNNRAYIATDGVGTWTAIVTVA